ncbi:MAG: hypothetical protein JO189_29900 [Deltaproteobacteria bacterium]|nr:hypothetical protein [Deltaproteobacteria bacterium]
MSQEHRNSIVENEEPIEVPYPPLIGHRKKFDLFEQELTGGQHIGHLPVYVIEIEGWIFRRCRCGFSLALTPSGAIWWLRTTKDAMAIKNFKMLLRALNSNCWAHPRLGPPKNAVISPPAVAQIATETSAAHAEESAISIPSPPALPEVQRKPNVKSSSVPSPAPSVEKPSPVKRRRTYVPNDATRTTRPRPNPSGR